MSALRIQSVAGEVGQPVPAEDQAAIVEFYCQNIQNGCVFYFDFFKFLGCYLICVLLF